MQKVKEIWNLKQISSSEWELWGIYYSAFIELINSGMNSRAEVISPTFQEASLENLSGHISELLFKNV